ncbi:hypothetical protein GOP47_0001272 [Adiantum capillus-veneris]|uniref:Leucine-rich repeat-containing N-terminal plant-type domain-containing protein n=1 Tax=Adiantum capillus-veneris TaxID=13818 RepID=A0A9D4VFA1_ADICA|nr:hypothetical protein GOP47_0000730 [Adiantum capillus-veneris]KAI5085103.1 hypothetical protein GOP47_0001272 [Adiantum capillus-veneris]
MRTRKAVLMVALLLVLFSKRKGSAAFAQTLGDDAMCLQGVLSALASKGGGLSSWTSTGLKTPCLGSSASSLMGVGCNNNRVYSITLNASKLAGTISPSLANCTLLETLDISSNRLEGPIPPNIGNLSYLVSVNLSNNHLDGNIPVELSMCAYLNAIDLHANQLSGPIPSQLGLLQRLKFFDVSNNKLFGAIPPTLSNTSTGGPRFNMSSFKGNSDLYGYPLPVEPAGGLSVVAIVGIGLASGLVSLIVTFTAACVWLRVTEQGFAAQEGKISQLMAEA